PSSVLIFSPEAPGATSPPLPARRPNCLTSPCVTAPPAPGENRRDLECADPSRPAPIANRIVNLTLTAKRPRQPPENATAAGTLQSLSRKTNKGTRVRESGTKVSRRAGRGARLRHETSVKPRVLRILGPEAWRRARAGPQRDRTRRGARAARRYLRAVL